MVEIHVKCCKEKINHFRSCVKILKQYAFHLKTVYKLFVDYPNLSYWENDSFIVSYMTLLLGKLILGILSFLQVQFFL